MTRQQTIDGRVALVAGATRGAGRGVARALGEAGATVYCTGRSVAGSPSPYGRREIIDETAALVSAAGGQGIAVRVDHTREAEVEALVDRVVREHGRLDILVNSIAGETPLLGEMGASFWEAKLADAPAGLEHAIVSHVITAKHAARQMIRQHRGLIIEMTEGDILYGGAGIVHEIAKSSLKALAARMAWELTPHNVAAMAVTPGFLRSEVVLDHFGVSEENWRDAGKADPNFLASETPLFVGRAIAALAGDPDIMRRTGDVVGSWELAREYDIQDADGTRPDWGRQAAIAFPEIDSVVRMTEQHLGLLERAAARARRYLPKPKDKPRPVG